MRLSTKGLIVKENNFSDDRLVVALTPDKGLIKAFVRGARRLKNRNASSTGLLCYSDLTFFKYKDTYTLDEASAIEVFFELRSDIEKLALAQYFCELSLTLAPEEAEAEEFLRVVLNALSFLSNGKRDSRFIKAVTELRLLSISGYMPDIIACAGCSEYEQDEMFFDTVSAKIYCKNCKPEIPLISINRGVLFAMRHIVYSNLNKLFMFTLGEQSLKKLASVTEKYLLAQTERSYNTLDFYNSLKQ